MLLYILFVSFLNSNFELFAQFSLLEKFIYAVNPQVYTRFNCRPTRAGSSILEDRNEHPIHTRNISHKSHNIVLREHFLCSSNAVYEAFVTAP